MSVVMIQSTYEKPTVDHAVRTTPKKENPDGSAAASSKLGIEKRTVTRSKKPMVPLTQSAFMMALGTVMPASWTSSAMCAAESVACKSQKS